MTIGERIEQLAQSDVMFLTIIGAALSAAWWVIRKVFTSEKQVAILLDDRKRRDEQRNNDREMLTQIRDDVKDLRSTVIDHIAQSANPKGGQNDV